MPKTVKNKYGHQSYMLISGYKAPVSLYQSLKAHLHSLDMTKWIDEPIFTLKDLCGDAYWGGISNNHMKRLAGMCFTTMLFEGDFPIEFQQYKKSATNHYKFKH